MNIVRLMFLSRQMKNRRHEKDNMVTGIPPLTFTAKKTGTLKNYRIYGNTVSGESVGDMTANGYKVPVIISGINLFDESVVVDKEVNTALSNYQVYHQGGILYINGVTTSTQADVEIANMSGINTEALEYINQNCVRYVFTSIIPGVVQIRYSITGSENYFYASNSYTSAPSRNANRLVLRLQKDYQYDHEPIGILIKKEQIQSGYEPYHTPVTTNIYLPEPIKMIGDEAEYIDFKAQKQYFADGTSVDVELPALPTIAGTNVLAVGTEVQPSRVKLMGRIKEGES